MAPHPARQELTWGQQKSCQLQDNSVKPRPDWQRTASQRSTLQAQPPPKRRARGGEELRHLGSFAPSVCAARDHSTRWFRS